MASSSSITVGSTPTAAVSAARKIWYVDGVSCLGKTTFIKSLGARGLKLDFAERVQSYPDFKKKSQSHIMQILYTSTFCHDVYSTILGQKNDDDEELPLFIDRSPVSEIAYELLFKHFNDEAVFESTFVHLENLDMFAKYPTIFLIPHLDHAAKIVEQMKKRQNGLDFMDKSYVERQIIVFTRIANRFKGHPNVRVININPEMEIYSQCYFGFVARKLKRVAFS